MRLWLHELPIGFATAMGDANANVTDHIFHAKDYDGSGIWRNAAGDEAAIGNTDE